MPRARSKSIRIHPHSLATVHADQINADRLAFVRCNRVSRTRSAAASRHPILSFMSPILPALRPASVAGDRFQASSRRTAADQPASFRSRIAASICGVKRRPRRQRSKNRSGSGKKPACRPARYAAPSAVVSLICGRSTVRPIRSAGLHCPVRPDHAAVDTQGFQRALGLRPVRLHGAEKIGGLEADALERGLRKLARPGRPRQAKQGAADIRPPVGGAQADEGRNEDDLLRRVRCRSERPGFFGALHDVQAVTQPLHRRARDEDRAFERIVTLAAELVGDGGQEPVVGGDRRAAGVKERKAPGPIGRLEHARCEARLTDQCRLLIAGDSIDRDRCPNSAGSVTPKAAEQSSTVGRMARGTPNSASSSSSQRP